MLLWAVLMVTRYVNMQDFIFSQTWKIYFLKQTFELHQDDGLILQWPPNRQKEKKLFKDIGFNIDIQANLKEVFFFDVTLNLQMVQKTKQKAKVSIHCWTIHRKSSNSYKILSLKDSQKVLPTKKV